MVNTGNVRLFYLLLIIIGASSLGFGIHSASADAPDCSTIAPAPNVNYNGCDFSNYPSNYSFQGVDLHGATFVGAQLSGVDFTGANLVAANFNNADNDASNGDTIFINANLTRATFVNANTDEGLLSFQNANLHYVDFTGADISFSEITSGADLSGSNFSGAIIQGTDFTQSVMENVIFSSTTYVASAIFNAVDFTGSQLSNVDLSNNNFDGANFTDANLSGSSLANADLVDAILDDTSMPTSFKNTNLQNVDFTGATMSADTIFTGADTSGANLQCTGNPICITGNTPPPVIHFDQIQFTGGSSISQVNATAWKIGAAGGSGTNVQFTGVYATIGSNTIPPPICTPNNTVFPIGTTKITCTATDPNDPTNTSTSYFYIIIADTTPPVVTPPSSPVIVEATGILTPVSFHVTAYDVVQGPLTPICIPGNGTTFVLGSTPVTCTATDSNGNTGSATFTITVHDTTPPKITTGNVTAEATGPGGAIVVYHASAYDLVDGYVIPTCTPALNNTMVAIGTNTLTCSATDSHHNTSTKPLIVTVHDTTPPTITTPANITTPATGTVTQVTLGTPTVHDLVDPNPIVTNNAPVSGFPIGETDVTWTAKDHSGNSATAVQIVIITSNVPVTITAPSDITKEATGPLTQMALGTPTFTDPLDQHPTITNNVSTIAPNGFPVAQTTITWHLVDKYGNTANSPQIVTVKDTTPPTITPSSNPQYAEATGPGGASLYYHVTAFDLVDGYVTPNCTPLNGTQLVIGSASVTCTATDSHHNTSLPSSFTITVRDTTGPVMTISPNPVIVEAVNQNGAPVTYNVTATDLVTGHASASCTPSSGSIFGLGLDSILCTAQDKATPPNTSTTTFTITVHDTTPPTITAPPNITMITTGTLTPVTLGTPTVSDAVDPNPIVTNNAPAAGFPVGTTIVTWTATDHSGNSKTVTQTVVILPNNTPGKVNGGGSIGKGIHFNMNVQSKDGLTFKGHLDYDDKSAKIDLDSKTITGLYVDSTSTKANFTGTATLNGKTGYTFKAYVIDNGNPGKNDFFQIAIFDSTGHQVYAKNGKLITGNLHVDQKCDVGNDSHDHDPRDQWNNGQGNNGQGNNGRGNNGRGNNGRGNNGH